MRSIVMLAACAGLAVVSLPLVANAQATGQTTTQNDVKTIWQKFQGSWAQTKGSVKEQWGKLTDDDLLAIEGRRDQLVGKIQTRYGITKQEAEAQVGTWEQRRYRDM